MMRFGGAQFATIAVSRMAAACAVLLLPALLMTGFTAAQNSTTLNPNFPVVDGQIQVDKRWSVKISRKSNRRIEDGSLVIWRPGFTIWIDVVNHNGKQSARENLNQIRKHVSSGAFGVEEESDGGLLRLAYRLNEPAKDKRVAAFYCFAVTRSGHIQMAVYFDDEKDLPEARAVWRSLKEKTAP